MLDANATIPDRPRLARRYREEAAELITFVHRVSDPRVKAELLELAQRYLDLAQGLESARAA